MADPTNDASHRGPPLPDIQRALEEQYTDAVREKAHRFAEKRAAVVRRAGWPIPKNYAEELVHDAFTNIWLGVRRWDPATPLYFRLCWIIKDRTWREVRRTQHRQHVSFELAANDPKLDVESALRLAASSVVDDTPVEMIALTRSVVAALQQLARNDQDARAILACWEQGFIERDDVRALTGLTELAFRAARERILRLEKRLPPDLREAAHDLLRSAS